MTLIKSLILAVPLVAGVGVLQAEILYKWTEADGTLTFSPTPPPKSSGIAFEKVGDVTATKAESSQVPVMAAASEPAVNRDTTQATPSEIAPVINPVTETPLDEVELLTPDVQLAAKKPTTKNLTNRKSQQCNELVKRVMSLERLLSTPLDAETMDNAVLQMAKYQQSYNQACDGMQARVQ